MRKTLLILLLPVLSLAQVKIRSVTEKDANTIPYPNRVGNTISSMAHAGTVTLKDGSTVKGKITFFKKDDALTRVKVKTEEDKKEIEAAQIASVSLDPIIKEGTHPNNYKNLEKNFQPGYIILTNGVKLNGKIAQERDFSDYGFFINAIFFLPDGSDVASYFRGGRLTEFSQQVNGVTNLWDGYADGYLLRLVDGRYRLSRNPYSKTKNEFFTGIKNQVADSLAKDAARAAFVQGIKDGKDLNESIEDAGNAASVVGEVLGSVEINKKEYLILDTKTQDLVTVNESTFAQAAARMNSSCGTAGQASWGKIEEFVRNLNALCK